MLNHRIASLALLVLAGTASAQGPLILMGIDAEDGGVGGHGPITAYTSVITAGIAPNVTNGGAGLLVIGGGKNPFDNVTEFWDEIGNDTGLPVTYVNGAANISAQSLAGFGIVGVASSFLDTPSGGLTAAEGAALNARANDIRDHVNGGGGLLGFSQGGIAAPYGYVGALGSFSVNTALGYSQITPTAAGMSIGITQTNLDICCWHDEYLTFPGFLEVLATNDATGNAAAIGGFEVVIVEDIALTPTAATLPINTMHTVTATVADDMGNPIVGTTVTFEILAGPHAGMAGMGITDASGESTFTYLGTSRGQDTIEACFFDMGGIEICSNIATADWTNSTCFLLDFETEDDLATLLLNGQAISPLGQFGLLLTVDGLAASGEGAAVFDSDPLGPNAGGSDPDLLVDTGNLLILQEDPTQTVPGLYDTPDDDYLGGVLIFQFEQNTELCSVDLVDIDLDAIVDQGALVTLFDTGGLTRRYHVAEGFTEDIDVDGAPGYRTLDLRTLMPQMGFAAMATATEDAGFDATAVRTMLVELDSSGGVDNLSFNAALPAQKPAPGKTSSDGALLVGAKGVPAF